MDWDGQTLLKQSRPYDGFNWVDLSQSYSPEDAIVFEAAPVKQRLALATLLLVTTSVDSSLADSIGFLGKLADVVGIALGYPQALAIIDQVTTFLKAALAEDPGSALVSGPVIVWKVATLHSLTSNESGKFSGSLYYGSSYGDPEYSWGYSLTYTVARVVDH
jgi:hypothetical protein